MATHKKRLKILEAVYDEALIRAFMGELKLEIVEAVRMFRPQSLKDAISLCRMKVEQL